MVVDFTDTVCKFFSIKIKTNSERIKKLIKFAYWAKIVVDYHRVHVVVYYAVTRISKFAIKYLKTVKTCSVGGQIKCV